MKLSDLLVDAWVVAPCDSPDLGHALGAILDRVSEQGLMGDVAAKKFARDLAFGSQGEVARIGPEVVVVVGGGVEGLEEPALGLAIGPAPLRVSAEGRPEPGTARVVMLVLTGGKLTGARQEIVPALARALREPERVARLLSARTAADLRAMEDLMETEVHPRLVVEDALEPVRYRVYPDTPLSEVVDLIVRRGVHAVPVVGERYEVLGILTAGDALAHMLRHGRRDEEGKGRAPAHAPTARDYMTRSVLCVSEDQSLSEAANMMVNRGVQQIPVVREGELVGFVTRESILRALHGTLETEANQERESESQP